MIEEWLEHWVKNIHRVNENAVNKECGIRPYGIEYRIMVEGGIVPGVNAVYQDQLISDIDLAWHRVRRSFPDEMIAVKEYYKRGSYRAVRLALGCSQHSSVTLTRRGEDLIQGALLMLY